MNIELLCTLYDRRINGLSISATTTVADYINWFQEFGRKNTLEDQRPVLKSRTANMIRNRLIKDLEQGAVIPPIVLGFTTNSKVEDVKIDDAEMIVTSHINDASVIDGMQRTAALQKAFEQNSNIGTYKLQLSIWITQDAISLIYRMLVLNTGQSPWDVKRQMEVMYKPLVEECKQTIEGIVINTKNDSSRRSDGGEYQASSIVELFLVFSNRKEIVNTSEKLADDFARLDVTQLAGDRESSELFYHCIKLLFLLDIAISRYKGNRDTQIESDKYIKGMDLFTNMPAKVGFVVAFAQNIMGRNGTLRTIQEQRDRFSNQEQSFKSLCTRIGTMDQQTLCNFLSFDLLNEKIESLSKKKIGDEQRRFFRTAFDTLFESKCDVENFQVLWNAY